MTEYRDAAVTLWGDAGALAHDLYAKHRANHFADLPESLPIVIGITAYGRCLGLTRTGWQHGPRISLESRRFAQGENVISDVLLHEMAHASLALAGLESGHDSNAWYAMVRKLSPAVLGCELEVRRGGGRKSVRVANPRAGEDGQPATVVRKQATEAPAHGDVARWPQSFRPADYDWGTPVDCPSY